MKCPFLALLLIVNLSTCAVRCLSCEAEVTAGEEYAPAACSCCSHDSEAPVSQVPKPCGDDCGCQNCICEGAVVEAVVQLPDLIEHFVVWAQPLMLDSQAGVSSSPFFQRRFAVPSGQFRCGRDARIAYQSWLIWTSSDTEIIGSLSDLLRASFFVAPF